MELKHCFKTTRTRVRGQWGDGRFLTGCGRTESRNPSNWARTSGRSRRWRARLPPPSRIPSVVRRAGRAARRGEGDDRVLRPLDHHDGDGGDGSDPSFRAVRVLDRPARGPRQRQGDDPGDELVPDDPPVPCEGAVDDQRLDLSLRGELATAYVAIAPPRDCPNTTIPFSSPPRM